MDEYINGIGVSSRREAYEKYMSLFSEHVSIHGLVSGQVGYEELRSFYASLFSTLGNSMLVSDDLIVAGPMAAQRYHSLGVMTGEFDGAILENKPVGLKGQTFFRFNDTGQIVSRWSNHDHGFRMSQTIGPDALVQGSEIQQQLNGAGLSEQAVYDSVTELVEDFNRFDAPGVRVAAMESRLDESVSIWGIADNRPLGKQSFIAWMNRIWQQYPDVMLNIESVMSAWSMAAVRVNITGSRRPVDQSVLQKKADIILEFSSSGQIVSIWASELVLKRCVTMIL